MVLTSKPPTQFFVANFVFTLVIYLLFQKAFEVTRYPYQSPLTSGASSNVPLLQNVPGVREDDYDYEYDDDDDEWVCGSKVRVMRTSRL